MKKNLLLTTFLTGTFILNFAYAAEVSDWSGLSSNDTPLILTKDIDAGTTLIQKTITQTIDGNNFTIDGTNGNYNGSINAQDGADLTFKNLTVTNFSAAKFFTTSGSASVSVIDSLFKNNSYSSNGGAFSFGSTGTLDLTNVDFENNINDRNNGGALYFDKGSLNITGGDFSSNSSKGSGGALYINKAANITDDDDNKIANVLLKNVTFRENTITGGSGGAIGVSTGNKLDLNNITFDNNQNNGSSMYGGGAISLDDNNEISITGSNFTSNLADGLGGAIVSRMGTVMSISETDFQKNSSQSGGGAIYISEGSLTLKDVNFLENHVEGGSGGAAYLDDETSLNMQGGRLYKNTVTGAGGAFNIGMGNKNNPTLIKLTDVTFEENSSKNAGGAINLNSNNKMELDNVTFKTNSVTGNSSDGGAIRVNHTNNVIIKNSHFENNSVTRGANGGAIASGIADLTIDNTKFLNNNGGASGGAIFTETSKDVKLRITNSEFKGNHTIYDAGAIMSNGSLDIYNTVFDDNYTDGSAGSTGGAINIVYYEHSDHHNIILSTFKNNHADDKIIDEKNKNLGYGGAIFYNASNNNALIDTVFTGNQAHEGGAIYAGAKLDIFADTRDVEFSGNIARADDFADLADSYNGGAAIYVDSADILSLNASEGKKIVFNDTIASYGDNNININVAGLKYTDKDDNEVLMGNTGEIQFNNYVGDGKGNIFSVNLHSGTLSIGQNSEKNTAVLNPDGYINFNNFYIKGDSVLNTVNNTIGEFAPLEFKVDNGVNWQYQFDIDLDNQTSDKLVVTENLGNLELSLLNVFSDTDEEEVRITYSDTNINGQLKDGYKITTSKKTYDITAENNDNGSALIFKAGAPIVYAGLAGAVKNASDVYSNTSDSDEIVEQWIENDNKVKADLIVNANDKGIIAGQDNLDGMVVNGDYTLTINNATDFSGFNVAINNTAGTLNLNNSDFTGNKGVAAISNQNGEVNITASNRDVLFANPNSSYEIQSDGGKVNIQGSNSVTFAGKLQGSNNAQLNLNAGNVTFNDEISGFNVTQKAGNVNIESLKNSDYALNSGLLNIKDENNFLVNNFAMTGGNINLANGKIGEITAEKLTLNGNINLSLDVDLANEQMDRLSPNNTVYTAGNININKFNLLSDGTKSNLKINFTENSTLKDHISTDVKKVYGPIYNYDVNYDPTNGDFLFSGGGSNAAGYNPAILASAVAAQLGGYLTQLNSYDEAFRNMDMYKLMTKDTSAKADSGKIYDPIIAQNQSYTAWLRPYSTSEDVSLKNGPKVSNKTYGSFFGAESQMYNLSNGWDGIFGLYMGYNGSRQSYDDVDIRQNGATLGLVGMAYKDNFFTGLTANIGTNVAKADTMYGDEDFNMLMSGIASKSGYNFELKDGKYIVQPNFLMSYSIVKTFDYTNASGIKVNADTLHALHLEPGVKLIGNLDNGWQPYMSASYVYNTTNDTNFTADGALLPELSVKSYVKYGLGIRKSEDEKYVGYLQTYFTDKERNGVGIQAGLRIPFGK